MTEHLAFLRPPVDDRERERPGIAVRVDAPDGDAAAARVLARTPRVPLRPHQCFRLEALAPAREAGRVVLEDGRSLAEAARSAGSLYVDELAAVNTLDGVRGHDAAAARVNALVHPGPPELFHAAINDVRDVLVVAHGNHADLWPAQLKFHNADMMTLTSFSSARELLVVDARELDACNPTPTPYQMDKRFPRPRSVHVEIVASHLMAILQRVSDHLDASSSPHMFRAASFPRKTTLHPPTAHEIARLTRRRS